MKLLSKIVLKLWGWKIHGIIPEGIKKCVIIAAPHTSNADFFVGRLAYFSIGVKVRFLIKKEVFVFPFGPIVKAWGGIGVDRGKRNNIVNQVVSIFNDSESLYFLITPEGTRKYVARWKKGFYLIAQQANVPIALGYADFKKKEAGIGPVIYPSGDYDKDLKFIEDFYRDKTAKHPEKFNLTPPSKEKPKNEEEDINKMKNLYCNKT